MMLILGDSVSDQQYSCVIKRVESCTMMYNSIRLALGPMVTLLDFRFRGDFYCCIILGTSVGENFNGFIAVE